jgi:hypothetical protein
MMNDLKTPAGKNGGRGFLERTQVTPRHLSVAPPNPALDAPLASKYRIHSIAFRIPVMGLEGAGESQGELGRPNRAIKSIQGRDAFRSHTASFFH